MYEYLSLLDFGVSLEGGMCRDEKLLFHVAAGRI
jgi:hypothetical protein